MEFWRASLREVVDLVNRFSRVQVSIGDREIEQITSWQRAAPFVLLFCRVLACREEPPRQFSRKEAQIAQKADSPFFAPSAAISSRLFLVAAPPRWGFRAGPVTCHHAAKKFREIPLPEFQVWGVTLDEQRFSDPKESKS